MVSGRGCVKSTACCVLRTHDPGTPLTALPQSVRSTQYAVVFSTQNAVARRNIRFFELYYDM